MHIFEKKKKAVHTCSIIFYILLKKADFYFHAVHRVKCMVTFVVYFTDYSINSSIYVELQTYLFDKFYSNHKLMLLNNIQTQMLRAALLQLQVSRQVIVCYAFLFKFLSNQHPFSIFLFTFRFMNNRAPSNKRYQPTEYEHAANCATHAVSCVFTVLTFTFIHLVVSDLKLRNTTSD